MIFLYISITIEEKDTDFSFFRQNHRDGSVERQRKTIQYEKGDFDNDRERLCD